MLFVSRVLDHEGDKENSSRQLLSPLLQTAVVGEQGENKGPHHLDGPTAEPTAPSSPPGHTDSQL